MHCISLSPGSGSYCTQTVQSLHSLIVRIVEKSYLKFKFSTRLDIIGKREGLVNIEKYCQVDYELTFEDIPVIARNAYRLI